MYGPDGAEITARGDPPGAGGSSFQPSHHRHAVNTAFRQVAGRGSILWAEDAATPNTVAMAIRASAIRPMRNASICNRLSLPYERPSGRSRGLAGTRKHVGMQARLPYTCIKKRSFRALCGVTLIELMVGLALLAILMAIAVPSFRGTAAANRLSASTNEVVNAMALARSEAIRRGGRVTVCKSADGAACTTAGGWEQGWIVFVDSTRAGANPSVDAGEVIVSRVGAQPDGLTIQGTAAVANYVSFAADGTMRTMAGAALAGGLRVCSTASVLTDGARARRLDISSAGRLASTTPSVLATCPAPV